MPRILSIDGGGIRGVIPAVVLAELEQRLGRPAARMFDLIAGASTGGIIALALVRPDAEGEPALGAAELVDFYTRLGPDIFDRSIGRTVRRLGSLAGPKYDPDRLRDALAEQFGDAMLSDALRDVVVPAYDIERREPFFFKSHYARVRAERDYPMRFAALATAAGPTYFPPVRLPVQDHIGYRALVDGGVYANNPAMCAYVEGLNLFGVPVEELDPDADRPEPAPSAGGPPDPGAAGSGASPLGVETDPPGDAATPTSGTSSGSADDAAADEEGLPPLKPRVARGTPRGLGVAAVYPDEYPYRPAVRTWDADWFVVSLGTGRSEREIPYRQARGWGLARWARPIIDVVFDGVSDTVDYQMRHVLRGATTATPPYVRLQTDLVQADPGLGAADPENIRRLKQAAYELIKERAREMNEVVARLRE